MKKTFLFLLGVLFIAASCVSLDEVNNKIADLEARLKKVETDLNSLSSTADGLSTTIKALQDNVYVERVTKNADGYVITFTNGEKATIYNGKDGQDGLNGQDGKDGKDGSTPNVGVAAVEGQSGYFWTVNGELVKDKDGKYVSATSQVPEFKFEDGNWYYRFENGNWAKCSEGQEEEILIIEKSDSVIIKIGDTLISVPKEKVSPVIESINPVITIGAKRLFVPVGQPLDLTEWFTVTPEDAVKTAVSFTYSNDAPFTINEAGILNATGAGSYTVTIVADGNPEAQTSIVIRSAETPDNVVPERTINPDNKLVLYEGSIAEYNTFEDFGGSVSFNPFNGAIAGVVNGTLNMRFAVPAKEDATLTRQNGHLHFMFYIDDIKNVKPDNVELIELTNGTWDVKEIHWNNRIFSDMKSGWNEVDLAFKDATDEAGEPFDPTKPCFVRIVVPASGPNGTWAPFQFKDFFVYADNNAITEIKPVITIGANRLFIPVGKSVDLKEWFDVVPATGDKAKVKYTFTEGAPFTISEDGVLTATGEGSYTVNIISKDNEDNKSSIVIRTADAPGAENEPQRAIDPENKHFLYEGSLAEYNTFQDFGGSTSFNPFNGAIAGVVNGTLNTRFAVPAKTFSEITRENGHLHFMFYIDDIANVHPDNVELIELTNGTWDVKEIHWNNRIFSDMKSGWNEVDLAFKDATDELGDPFDPTQPCFFRCVVPASGPDGSWAPFQFKDFFVYAAPEIEAITPVITCGANRLFIPVGKSVDLKDWFTLTPAAASKGDVTYSFADDAPFTVSEAGVLTATGEGSYTVTVASKKNADIKCNIVIRSADAPGIENEPTRAINPDNKHVLYEGSLAEFNTFEDFGGSTSFNPFNGAIAGVVNGTLNTRFAVPVKTFSELTRQNGHLHFMFYIDDIANVHPDNVELIELTNGTWDKNEIHWNNRIFSDMKSGWNEVDLAFSDATDELGDPFDPTKPCFVRIVVPASGPDQAWAPFQFKDFFVYAAESPKTVSEMLTLAKGDAFTAAESLVAGVTTKGFIATDGAKAVYVYTNSAPAVAVGDKVTFKGKKTTYNGVHEIETVTELTVKSSGNPVAYPAAKDITAEVGTYSNTEAEFVSLTATLAKSGNYYNLNVEGVTTKQGSIVYPAAYLDAASFDGKKIKVTGFYNGLSGSGGKFVNIVATKIEEVVPVKITIDGDLSDWDAVEGVEANSFKMFKYASDEANLYLYFKIKRSKIIAAKADEPSGSGQFPFNWRRYIAFGIDTDNNAETGTAVTYAGMNIPGCEAGANFYPFRGNATSASGTDGLQVVNGVEEQGGISTTIGSSVPDGANDKVTAFGQVDDEFVYVEAQVARTAIGSPAAGQAKIQLSLAWDITDIMTITLK